MQQIAMCIMDFQNIQPQIARPERGGNKGASDPCQPSVIQCDGIRATGISQPRGADLNNL